jgi:DNA-binding transcriptional regulator YdaS (Cro superfamily)
MTSRYDLSQEAYERAFAAFQGAVAKAEGQTAFANICRCTQGNISQLLRNRSLLPERLVLRAEAGTGIPRHHLRPDIYPIDTSSVPPSDTVLSVQDRLGDFDRNAILKRASA